MLTIQKKFTLTLIVYFALILALSSVSHAKGYAQADLHRRNHVNLKRIVKRRPAFDNAGGGDSPTFPFPPAAGAGAPPPPPAAASSTSLQPASGSPTPSGGSAVGAASGSSTPSASPSASPSAGLSASLNTTISAAPSASLNSSLSALPSVTPSSTNTPSATPSKEPAVQPTANDNGGVVVLPSKTVTQTASVTDSAPTDTPQVSSAASATKTATVTVIIVVASCVGGIAILWTVFRKWKLGRSSQFDKRLQPIDWQPTSPDEGIIPAHRRAGSGASSFHSGSGHSDNGINRGYSGYGATSDHGHGTSALNPIPDHDFTATGPANLAPVGGYADLARGPSPQPQMHEALSRGPSINRQYDQYGGIPLHHQTGYGAQDYDHNGPRY